MADADRTLEALLQEKRQFAPPKAFARKAHVSSPSVYRRANRDFEKFWEGFAKELDWYRPWKKVLDWNPPHGQVVRRRQAQRRPSTASTATSRARASNKAALIWEGEPGDQRTLTYRDLYREVNKFANVLRKLGVRKGDRVTIYLPMIPELPIAMLACARIGAIHSVVFGGFSAESLRDRINDQGAKVLVTADGGWRRGNVVPLKQIADEALTGTPTHRGRGRGPAHRHADPRSDAGQGALVAPAHGGGARSSASRRRWTPRTPSTSSTRPARRESRRASSTPPAATWSAPTRPRSGSSTSRTTTSTGARPTSAGSPATPTSCTGRSPTARRA